MTEQEWLASDDSKPMLAWLKGRASDRKLRLFMAACLWRAFATARTTPKFALASLDVLERMAEGGPGPGPKDRKLLHLSANAHYAAVCTAKWQDVRRGPARITRPEQAAILRDLFGNPFRPVVMVLDPSWLTSAVTTLARQMNDSRDFSPMPIWADALEEAGCGNLDILAHCRG